MATFELRPVANMANETDIIVRVGEPRTFDGWNLTAEKAAIYPFLVGRISRDGRRFHATSYGQQTFRRGEWRQNAGSYHSTFEAALGWLKADVLAALEPR